MSYVEDFFEKEILAQVLGKSNEKKSEECNFFSDLCKEKIDFSQNTDEIVKHEKFIRIVDELNCKFPFFNILEFVKDFVNGNFSKDIIRRYQFSKNHDIATCLKSNALNLPRKRQKILYPRDKSGYARRKNLSNEKMEDGYKEIVTESKFFEKELEYLIQYNIARAIILFNFLSGLKLEKDEIIIDEIINEHNYFSFFEGRADSDTVLNFNKIKNIIQDKFEEIELELKKKNIIYFENNNYILKLNYDEIEEQLIEIINNEIDGIGYSKIFSKLVTKYNIISLLPHHDLISMSLKKFEEQGIIKVEAGFGNPGLTGNTYYSFSNYQTEGFIEKIRQGGKKFFGRTNTDPFRFIEDLQYLTKGDFDDDDDQVTRIAGLILSGTQDLISEREKFEEFDFLVDMTGFSPNEEEMKIMQEAKFVVNSNSKKIHVKVMINEDVTFNTIESIRNILPKNEQAVIISFKKISDEVEKSLPQDFSIQILGKKSIQLWAEITPIVPSRKGAITRVMDGKYVGKIAKINLVNYETGKAIIELIPSSVEVSTYIGDLQEINLFDDPIVDDFSTMSQNYFEFLKILGKNSDGDEFQRAVFKSEENSHLVDEEIDHWDFKEDVEFKAKILGDLCVINANKDEFKKIFDCTCSFFQTKWKFCSHLITLLNEIGIRNNFFSETWGKKDENLLFACLEKISNS